MKRLAVCLSLGIAFSSSRLSVQASEADDNLKFFAVTKPHNENYLLNLPGFDLSQTDMDYNGDYGEQFQARSAGNLWPDYDVEPIYLGESPPSHRVGSVRMARHLMPEKRSEAESESNDDDFVISPIEDLLKPKGHRLSIFSPSPKNFGNMQAWRKYANDENMLAGNFYKK